MKEMNKKRIVSFVIAVMIFIAIVFSEYFIMTNVDHDCTGTECPVCHAIHISQETIKLLGTALIVIALTTYLYKELSFGSYKKNIVNNCVSLFSLKVRLNN